MGVIMGYPIDARYIKTGVLAPAVQEVEDRSLVLAFVGYNFEQTRAHFEQFFRDNAQQVAYANIDKGVMWLSDGTVVKRIDPGFEKNSAGWRFDQIIVADDFRHNAVINRWKLLNHLEFLCSCSTVPKELRYQYYDVDAPEPMIYGSMRTDAGPAPLEVAVYGRFKV